MKRKPVKHIQTIREMVYDAATSDPNHIAFMYKENKDVISISNKEFYDSVEALGAAVTHLGFNTSHIACVGVNSYPWILTFVSSLMGGGVFVPLDSQLDENSLVFLLNQSNSEIVFCDASFSEMFAKRRDDIPNLKKIVVFGKEDNDGDILSFDKLIKDGASLDKTEYDSSDHNVNALKYLVFTSGTTGIAKGVMLTEHNIVSGIYYGMQVSRILTKALSVLPYHHTYEAVCDILVSIHSHSTICINDSLRHVQENLKFYKPDYIYLVPAFAEHFYNLILKGIRKKKMEKQFFGLIKLSNALRKAGIDMRRKFFGQVLDEFGGNLKKIVCGGAPIRPDIGQFFDSIGISMTGGYGITECSPLVSVNDDKDNNYASAGHRIPCIDWKIDSPDSDGIGEICVKGDVVMLGYYNQPELTAEAIRDGWFYTGDYGYINQNDEIVITGRKKNIIVLNNGKNIYPEEIEALISEIPYITEVVVRGIKNEHGQETGLSAEVYIEDASSDISSMESDIKDKLSSLPSYKHINSIIKRDTPFNKTTTNKIKR